MQPLALDCLGDTEQYFPRLAVPDPLVNEASIPAFKDIRFWEDVRPDNIRLGRDSAASGKCDSISIHIRRRKPIWTYPTVPEPIIYRGLWYELLPVSWTLS